MNQITIVDARMGRGKSSAAIRYMNRHKDSKRFLYITPAAQTLDYIGITSEEIDEAYRNLNLGSVNHNYLVDSDIGETEILMA